MMFRFVSVENTIHYISILPHHGQHTIGRYRGYGGCRRGVVELRIDNYCMTRYRICDDELPCSRELFEEGMDERWRLRSIVLGCFGGEGGTREQRAGRRWLRPRVVSRLIIHLRLGGLRRRPMLLKWRQQYRVSVGMAPCSA